MRSPVGAERGLALVRIEGHQQVHRAIHDGQDARIVAGVVAVQHLQVFDRGAQRGVVEIVHPQRRVGAYPQRGLGDHAELAVAEDHALEQFGILAYPSTRRSRRSGVTTCNRNAWSALHPGARELTSMPPTPSVPPTDEVRLSGAER